MQNRLNPDPSGTEGEGFKSGEWKNNKEIISQVDLGYRLEGMGHD